MSRVLIRARSHIESARQNRGSGHEDQGGGLLIHPDLFVLIDFRLFC
jgi:hypothetical protein